MAILVNTHTTKPIFKIRSDIAIDKCNAYMEFGRKGITNNLVAVHIRETRQAGHFRYPYLNSQSELELDKSMHNVMRNLKEIGKHMT